MPGAAALLAVRGGATCKGACNSDWAVSAAVTPPQPPLLRGTYEIQPRPKGTEREQSFRDQCVISELHLRSWTRWCLRRSAAALKIDIAHGRHQGARRTSACSRALHLTSRLRRSLGAALKSRAQLFSTPAAWGQPLRVLLVLDPCLYARKTLAARSFFRLEERVPKMFDSVTIADAVMHP